MCVFKSIFEKCEHQHLFYDPEFLHIDFEKLVITTAIVMFG